MAETVKLTLSAHHYQRDSATGKLYKPGESIEVDVVEAKRLIRAGVAVTANKTAEKAVSGPSPAN